ncbi:sulfotransferase [Methylomonas paludis]|uniref:Sulfotransferase n=1 Tax=Methylomonas paludis TaxID=1173101 RepID=A0A975R8C8_9GAMM|nr:sulfotransferase [Methylomonas paludis]QWF69827.1 sulfotransferase [Methylomonas paludis]
MSRQKNSAQALAGLGQSLCRLNRINEGIVFLLQAGKVLLKQAKLSKDIKYVLDLAFQLSHWHALEPALDLAQLALAIDGNSANANHIIALCLHGLNRHTEALAFSVRAVELAPREANAIILLAVLEAKQGELSRARQRLENLLATGQPNMARAHTELGVILDKIGEYDSAFQQLSLAGAENLKCSATQALDKTAVYRDINLYQQAYDPTFLQSSANLKADDGLPTPVFILGFYRSGTTLIEQILAAHRQIISSDEAPLLSAVLAELSKLGEPGITLPERIKSLSHTDISRLRKLYWQTAQAALGKQIQHKVLVDKTALNTLNIELINALFPEAVVIFAVRDPRDVCLSCFMQSFGLSTLTIHFLNWTDCARFYALIMAYWLSIRDQLSLNWIELRYEDLLADLAGQFSPIFAKIGLEWSAECEEFYLKSQRKIIKTPSFSQVTQPLYHSSAYRWRHYQKHFAAILPILEPFIKAYDYQPS